jgi:hypothetical protein
MTVAKKDLEIGKSYKITIIDCCVHAEVYAGEFLGRHGKESPWEYEFENAKFRREDGAWELENVEVCT